MDTKLEQKNKKTLLLLLRKKRSSVYLFMEKGS